ncbi:glyoxalase domain-containing protein 4 [Diorhabda carinulata]|uniref:glyoxalase domain-containing protein 4 n=1 Tax=Diorhabda sublineata TaxID=1163346 RepID=UPI0024E160BA|nr:glyoxalase domain-containing protein 4 [Diorhabda sublineata]XP_057652437.1 glyoxalase domain-containing protein 4 [Diorhabda carinulata]
MLLSGRALHYVFKIPNRKESMRFYLNVLGMKLLRHEEFSEGCEATCNGPYDGRWSKTMVGYGPEDNHFVIELTYNYGISNYNRGNDFAKISIRDKEILQRAIEQKWPVENGNVVVAPGGYRFEIIDEHQPIDRDPVESVTLNVSNLKSSLDYWNGILGLKIFKRGDKSALIGFKDNEAKLGLQEIGKAIDRGQAFGRIAFSIPYKEQEPLAKKVDEKKCTVLTPLTVLPTPGKSDVRVLILADPDGHEICFVDDEGFRQLSQPDYESEKILNIQMNKDQFDKSK